MRRLFAILALAAVLPGLVWAQSINTTKTDTSALITFTIDDSVGLGVWNSRVNACSSFRAIYEPVGGANSAQFKLHAIPLGSTVPSDATTLIQTFTTQVAEPGIGLNATGRYFVLEITRAQVGAEKTTLQLRCSNAQAL